ncbi:MAG: hypothetical protein C4321_10590, partial [Chloroflexota bacterium]
MRFADAAQALNPREEGPSGLPRQGVAPTKFSLRIPPVAVVITALGACLMLGSTPARGDILLFDDEAAFNARLAAEGIATEHVTFHDVETGNRAIGYGDESGQQVFGLGAGLMFNAIQIDGDRIRPAAEEAFSAFGVEARRLETDCPVRSISLRADVVANPTGNLITVRGVDEGGTSLSADFSYLGGESLFLGAIATDGSLTGRLFVDTITRFTSKDFSSFGD